MHETASKSRLKYIASLIKRKFSVIFLRSRLEMKVQVVSKIVPRHLNVALTALTKVHTKNVYNFWILFIRSIFGNNEQRVCDTKVTFLYILNQASLTSMFRL